MTHEERERLERDAQHALEAYETPYVQRVARAVLAALANPALFVPDTHAIVKKPELLDRGVLQR